MTSDYPGDRNFANTMPVEPFEPVDDAAGAAVAAGAAEAAERRDDRFSGIVAIIIAFATLVAAIGAFLQADASQLAGDRRDLAEQYALAALASAQGTRETAQVELETFSQWVEQRTQAGNALLGSLYASDDPERENSLIQEQERWETIAAATLQQSELKPDSEFGPEKDPTFPLRFMAAATEESLELNALQDGANEEANELDKRAAGYTAVLAMLAVAIYLFGLTLAVRQRPFRLGFLGIGLGMLAIGLVWMLQAAILPAYETSDEAAAEYAKAHVAAVTAFDSAGYRTAEEHYSRSIQLRPTFARAYTERASVIFLGASPQMSGFASIAPPEALARASEDLRKAVSLGLENAPTLGALGFNTFAEGVQSADLDLINQSLEYTRRAINLDPTEPVYRYNLGAALTAAGRFEDARGAYADAILVTIYSDTATGELRAEPYVEESWLAGALTDLEIVRRFQSELANATGRQDYDSQIRSLKEQIVGRVAAESVDAPAQSPAVFADIELQIFPAELQWQGNVQNYDETRDTISAQWYHNDTAGSGWAVIPEVSITSKPGVDTDGQLFQLSRYTGVVLPARCLPQGSYRVELYVNGRLAAEASTTTDFGALDAFMARDLTMAFCHPSDWVRREDRLPGFIDGFQSADGQYGAFGLRYSVPGSLREIEDLPAQIEDITLTSFAFLFPDEPVYDEASGTSADYFMGLAETAWRWYDYGTGYVRVGAGLTDDGAVLVGMVYGPYEWFNGTEPYRILSSMIRAE